MWLSTEYEALRHDLACHRPCQRIQTMRKCHGLLHSTPDKRRNRTTRPVISLIACERPAVSDSSGERDGLGSATRHTLLEKRRGEPVYTYTRESEEESDELMNCNQRQTNTN